MYGFLAELFGWDQREGYAAVLRRHMIAMDAEAAKRAEKQRADTLAKAIQHELDRDQKLARARSERMRDELVNNIRSLTIAENQPRPVARQVTGVPRAKRMIEALTTATAIVRQYREGSLHAPEAFEQLINEGWYGVRLGASFALGSYNGIRFDLESN